ncbi:MAG TPA: acyltransferase [Acidobacteriaceae bacterium]|nr:acyltransferase [Acidobacteriaceae bacterium]
MGLGRLAAVSGQIVETTQTGASAGRHPSAPQDRTQSPVKPAPRYPRQAELDVLRFVAFALVFFSHQPPPQRLSPLFNVGSAGLSVFFMLSAYLIVKLLLQEKDATGTVNVRAFALRRILRIWPLYLLAIALNALIGAFWLPARISGEATASLLLFGTNLYLIKRGWVLGCIGPLWSICIEEQFYLVVPWLPKFLNRRGMTMFFVLVLLLAYAVLASLGHQHARTVSRVWPNSFVQFQFFAMGGLLALADRDLRLRNLPRLALVGTSAVLWLLAILQFGVHSEAPAASALTLGTGYLLLLAGTSALLLGTLHFPRRCPAPLTYLGTISYGLYVFHEFWLKFFFDYLHWAGHHNRLGAAATLLLTTATAAISYACFERPVLRLKRRFEIVRIDS